MTEGWAIGFGIVGMLTGFGGLIRALLVDKDTHREKMAGAVLDGFSDLVELQRKEIEAIRLTHTLDLERAEADCNRRLEDLEDAMRIRIKELEEDIERRTNELGKRSPGDSEGQS